ncbi:MAG TPA: copper resistance protein CopC [Dehalococcoidia bacterium]|jgi:methionine-rich copper-binding protein CopC|nr:copper resistance protein CopC [Dehalococcoidia bacterium]
MRTKLILVTVAFAALGAIAMTTVVSAHSRPIRFEPSPGQVLATAPTSVSGWFTADLRRDPNWTFLQVRDASGNRVDTGETQISTDRRQLTVALAAGLGPGRYQVTWRGFDDEDGAIFGDCYYFYVGQAAADQAVTDRTRIDGGGVRECARIEFEAANGTPVASGTPQGTATPTAEHSEDEGGGEENGDAVESSDDDGSDGVPAWTVVLAAVLGIVVGGAGVKLAGNRG